MQKNTPKKSPKKPGTSSVSPVVKKQPLNLWSTQCSPRKSQPLASAPKPLSKQMSVKTLTYQKTTSCTQTSGLSSSHTGTNLHPVTIQDCSLSMLHVDSLFSRPFTKTKAANTLKLRKAPQSFVSRTSPMKDGKKRCNNVLTLWYNFTKKLIRSPTI